MEIITRLMEPGEAAEVQKIGRRSFGALEGFGLPWPKQALVALADGKIVGAVQYKFYRAGGKKVGYYDYAFIDRDYHGQGIGSILYKAVANHLWEQGCDALTALVKDDNVGSWGLLLKNGFARMSLTELARQFGFLGALRLYLGSVYGIAIGMDYHVVLRNQEQMSGKGGSAVQIASYFLMNLLLSVFLLFDRPEDAGLYVTAYFILLAGGVLAGYAGTLFSKRSWQFRLCNGGGTVCAFVNYIGGVYPMVGNWYPDQYEDADGFRRDMGIQALTGWIFVLLLSLVSVLAGERHILFRHFGNIGSIFLLYRMIAFYPFGAFGGGRVYRWSKAVFFLMAIVSLGVYALNGMM